MTQEMQRPENPLGNKNTPRRFNRRNFLITTGATALFLGCKACGIAIPPPGLPDYENEGKQITNPILRAVALLDIYDKPGGTELGLGHAGIFYSANKLVLMTDEHVESVGSGYKIFIPGEKLHDISLAWSEVPKTDVSNTNIDGSKSHVDSIQVAPLNDTIITQAVKDGTIKPLTAIPYSKLAAGASLAIPMLDTNSLARITIDHYDHDKNSYFFNIKTGENCPGYSGCPILELDASGQPTGRSVGLLRTGDQLLIIPDMSCGNAFGTFMPFPENIPSISKNS